MHFPKFHKPPASSADNSPPNRLTSRLVRTQFGVLHDSIPLARPIRHRMGRSVVPVGVVCVKPHATNRARPLERADSDVCSPTGGRNRHWRE